MYRIPYWDSVKRWPLRTNEPHRWGGAVCATGSPVPDSGGPIVVGDFLLHGCSSESQAGFDGRPSCVMKKSSMKAVDYRSSEN